MREQVRGQYQGAEAARILGAAAGGGCDPENSAKRVLPIETATVCMNKATYTLHEMVSALEDRLRPVLSATPTAGQEKERVVNAEMPYHLAGRISQSAESVETAVKRIAELLDRLEL